MVWFSCRQLLIFIRHVSQLLWKSLNCSVLTSHIFTQIYPFTRSVKTDDLVLFSFIFTMNSATEGAAVALDIAVDSKRKKKDSKRKERTSWVKP